MIRIRIRPERREACEVAERCIDSANYRDEDNAYRKGHREGFTFRPNSAQLLAVTCKELNGRTAAACQRAVDRRGRMAHLDRISQAFAVAA